MKRWIAGCVGAVLVAVALWLLLGRHDIGEIKAGEPKPGGMTASHGRARAEARAVGAGAIRGTVRDDAGAPVGKAWVCADVSAWRLASAMADEPICAATDPQGRYALTQLIAASYEVSAGAPGHGLARYLADAQLRAKTFRLAAGEVRDGVDLVLRRGGVEVSGVVNDIAGGPIAHARVRATSSGLIKAPPVETDASGTFSLWIDRGMIALAADAEGYAQAEIPAVAPGRFELLLTPAGSLAGQVIDASTGQPVEGARVNVRLSARYAEQTWVDISDSEGRFRVERLEPGRMLVSAITERGYGTAAASSLVGLGQHVDGVIVKLYPAHRVAGRVIVHETQQPTDDCPVMLEDRERDRRYLTHGEGDMQVADGVIAGRYHVVPQCQHYHEHRDYPMLEVNAADVDALTWEVDAGATIRGMVKLRDGTPLGGVFLFAHSTGKPPSASGDHSQPDGSYAMRGLLPGHYAVTIDSGRGVYLDKATQLELPDGTATVDQDFVLDEGGRIVGHLHDAAGKPLPNVEISIRAIDAQPMLRQPTPITDASGTFRADALFPGRYTVIAQHNALETLRKPDSAKDTPQGERVDVKNGETATVDLVVESQDGRITGVVQGAAGKPITDAFVVSAKETGDESGVGNTRREWWGDDKPALTGTDGHFTVEQLAPGMYTLRAYRKGGGEAFATHVAVGAHVTLQIKATGSIAGTVRSARGAPPQALKILVRDDTGFERQERPYHSDGTFVVQDLPAGAYRVTAQGNGGSTSTQVTLADGEARSDLQLVLDPVVDVIGHLVERGTHTPVVGMFMTVALRMELGIFAPETRAISDADGRFTLTNVPVGKQSFSGFAPGPRADYPNFSIARDLPADATSPFDLGTIEVLRARVQHGDPIGMLGIRFVTPAPGRDRFEIAWLNPTGPAATSGLRVGDVITGCDGVALTDFTTWLTLSRAPPGTQLALTTQRGPTYTVTLGPPPL